MQKRVVNVYRLITRGTLEEKIMGLQKFKMSIANTVISQDNASLQSMGTDQLLNLFTLDKVRRRTPCVYVVEKNLWVGDDAAHTRQISTFTLIILMTLVVTKCSLFNMNLINPTITLLLQSAGKTAQAAYTND